MAEHLAEHLQRASLAARIPQITPILAQHQHACTTGVTSMSDVPGSSQATEMFRPHGHISWGFLWSGIDGQRHRATKRVMAMTHGKEDV
jgi:hypothetical protein